ncbi:peptidoglycan DD-metalloendopeptidase family protein [Kangiella sp.]|uniref:peptidoglycan DD-metalloendopeptidase family protein n=1 Tax=Kangiella sp. TaxID=1920245 RepID=UPI003A8DF850
MRQETKDILKRSAVRSLWIVAIVLVIFWLQGCGNERLAPVEEREANNYKAQLHSFYPPSEVDNSQQFYYVRPGDTLYSIAFRYGLDYNILAQANDIDSNYTIHAGQRLNLQKARDITPAEEYEVAGTEPPGTQQSSDASRRTPVSVARRPVAEVPRTPVTSQSHQQVNEPQQEPKKEPKKEPVSSSNTMGGSKEPVAYTPNSPVKYWMWPTMGQILQGFSGASKSSKGIDIAGNLGDPVRASAAGRVVYAGRGLRGYGNLVIVKHNNDFISAYAHNRILLVKENEIIKAGQKIAEVGNTDSEVPKLHFEIRFKGKPVDPMRYLPKR